MKNELVVQSIQTEEMLSKESPATYGLKPMKQDIGVQRPFSFGSDHGQTKV